MPGSVGRATSDRGNRFLKAVGRRRPDSLRPLPVRLRPLGDLLVGPARTAAVRIRTGPATREALAEAGRPAATVGNVINLDSPPDISRRSVEIVAHELVHAARPSPRPRFFADDHDSHEERLATTTGRRAATLVGAQKSPATTTGRRAATLMRALEGRGESGRKSSSHLTWGTAGLAVAPGANPLTTGAVGQMLAGRVKAGAGTGRQGGGSDGGNSASYGTGANAGGYGTGSDGGNGGNPGGHGIAHRIHRSTRHRQSTQSGPGPDYLGDLPPAIARLMSTDAINLPAVDGAPATPRFTGAPGGAGGTPTDRFAGRSPFTGGSMPLTGVPTGGARPDLSEQSAHSLSADTLDWIIEAVEERILAELERRGLRFQPEVF